MDRFTYRVHQEAALAAAYCSRTRRATVDPQGARWVIIHDVPLPPGYRPATTKLLFLIPPSYPLTPVDWFYADRGLKGPNGKPFHHFDRPAPGRAPTLRNWAGCCLHIRTWRPAADPAQGDSLVSVCRWAQAAFARWGRR